MTNAPTISVLMAVYNGQEYLRAAVDSILAQTFTDFEFIIIDDGSSDQSLSILKEYEAKDKRIRLVSRPNKGLTKSLNEGIALAKGQYIARMDSDDVAFPERFAVQVKFMQANPAVACAGGQYELIDDADRYLTTMNVPLDDKRLQELALDGYTSICHPCAMMRRSMAQQVGGYCEDFLTTQDLDLWLRLGEIGKLANVPETILKYRLHPESVSEKKAKSQQAMIQMAAERARQRRGITDPYVPREHWRPAKSRKSQHDFALKYGWWAFNSAQRRTAMIYAARAIAQLPFSPAAWKLLLCAVLKPMKTNTDKTVCATHP
jgi:glycosyltransferase involved in cell wall biosynthesis